MLTTQPAPTQDGAAAAGGCTASMLTAAYHTLKSGVKLRPRCRTLHASHGRTKRQLCDRSTSD